MFRFFAAPLSAAVLGASALLAVSVAPAMAEGDAEAGESQFRRCAACHQVGEDAANRVGPQLNGLIGRQIAGVADFSSYSDELSARSDETWTAELLAEYIIDPTTFIDGRSRMPAQRLRPEQLDDLIAYLGTIPE